MGWYIQGPRPTLAYIVAGQSLKAIIICLSQRPTPFDGETSTATPAPVRFGRFRTHVVNVSSEYHMGYNGLVSHMYILRSIS